MKEEEAKTKWCPMARLSIMNQSIDSVGERELCIASGCMMWTWDTAENKAHSETEGFNPDDYQGHCGLAK